MLRARVLLMPTTNPADVPAVDPQVRKTKAKLSSSQASELIRTMTHSNRFWARFPELLQNPVWSDYAKSVERMRFPGGSWRRWAPCCRMLWALTRSHGRYIKFFVFLSQRIFSRQDLFQFCFRFSLIFRFANEFYFLFDLQWGSE